MRSKPRELARPSRASSSCRVSSGAVAKHVQGRRRLEHLEAAGAQREVAPDRRPQEAEHVGAGRGAKARGELLGGAGAADDLAALDDDDAQARPERDRSRRRARCGRRRRRRRRSAAPGEATAQPSAPRARERLGRGELGRARSRSPARPGCRRRPRHPVQAIDPTENTAPPSGRRQTTMSARSGGAAVRIVDDVVGPERVAVGDGCAAPARPRRAASPARGS